MFQVDNWAYFKVSTMDGVMRLGKKGKHNPRYIGNYGMFKRISNVAYEFDMLQELVVVHLVFHISMLNKCMGDPSLIIPTENVGNEDILSYEDILVHILDHQIHKLRTKEVSSVKVLWRNQFVDEAIWESDENIKKRYSHLFESRENAYQGTTSFLSTL